MENKRRFNRIFFSTPVNILIENESYNNELIDLSLKGALVKNTGEFDPFINENCKLHFSLEGSDVVMDMEGQIAHIETDAIGIKFAKIDIESVSHLKRLIAYNIGDEELLHRDLENLGEAEN